MVQSGKTQWCITMQALLCWCDESSFVLTAKQYQLSFSPESQCASCQSFYFMLRLVEKRRWIQDITSGTDQYAWWSWPKDLLNKSRSIEGPSPTEHRKVAMQFCAFAFFVQLWNQEQPWPRCLAMKLVFDDWSHFMLYHFMGDTNAIDISVHFIYSNNEVRNRHQLLHEAVHSIRKAAISRGEKRLLQTQQHICRLGSYRTQFPCILPCQMCVE